jgi:hypothetical protein
MKNIGGRGVLLLTTHPMGMRILSERSESKDLSSRPSSAVCPERVGIGRDARNAEAAALHREMTG